MKRLIVRYLVLLLFIITGCKKQPVDLDKQQKRIEHRTVILEDKFLATYPITDSELINKHILADLVKLSKTLTINNDIISGIINYEVQDKGLILSFIFEIEIIFSNTTSKIVKTLNYNYLENTLLIVSDESLQEDVVAIINNRLDSTEDIISYFEVLSLNYIINENNIVFIHNNRLKTFKVDIDMVNIISKPLEINEDKIIKQVALTFDDGPSRKTLLLLELLHKYNIKATFFILGKQALLYPDFVKTISENKHEIGNHSYTHQDFSKATTNEIIYEVSTTQQVLKNILGYSPQIMRLPYGAFRDDILEYIPMPIISWNVDSNDWRDISNDEKMKHIDKDLTDQAIILFHDFNQIDLEFIEEVIIKLLNKNYNFVTCYEYFNFRNLENFIVGKIYR